MTSAAPGEVIDRGAHIPELDFTRGPVRISTDRFHSREWANRERENLWMRVWQIAGRADEIPQPGDWKVHSIFDQSYVLVRGRDGVVRGFINACRHRGNAFCEGKGHSARFTCPYHNWSYALDGACLAVAKPDYEGPVEEFVGAKEELGLLPVSVGCFAGFIFINPNPGAEPLAEFLGEAGRIMAQYRLEEAIPVAMNVREGMDCNWKVVMDAFHEGYHVQGVHPEIVDYVDLSRERCTILGDHGATTVPFGGPGEDDKPAEDQVAAIRALPLENFPGLAEVLPHFEQLVSGLRASDGSLRFPEGVTARTLMQQASRTALSAKGLDVSGLTDAQMSDFQFWMLFPNVFFQVRAGKSTFIIAEPDPSGDPRKCHWRAAHYIWLPEAEREAAREPFLDVQPGDHYPYFLALQQDYEQMAIQQRGLENRALSHMIVTRQEPKVIHFHATLDRWMEGRRV